MALIENINYMLSVTSKKYPDKRWSIWSRRFILGIDRSSKTSNSLLEKTTSESVSDAWKKALEVVSAWQRSYQRGVSDDSRMTALVECQSLLDKVLTSENTPAEHYKL